MAIAVHCGCGKKFKVKDRLAGKAVRCPECKGPLRIPAGSVASKASACPDANKANRAEAPQIDEEQAILRVEKAQKKKQADAEADAAYREEQNKLIASYDQFAGKSAKGKKKKSELAPGKPRKVTVFTKAADACGTICSTLAFKYVFVVVLLGGGVVGSVFLVQTVANYVQEEGGPQAPKEQRIEALFKEAEAAIEAKKWGEARSALVQILQLKPGLEKHRRYRALKKKLDEGFEKG